MQLCIESQLRFIAYMCTKTGGHTLPDIIQASEKLKTRQPVYLKWSQLLGNT